MSHQVFISYRKSISKDQAQILKLRIDAKFGSGFAFLDNDDIQTGDDWEEKLKMKLEAAIIVIVIIGKGWTTSQFDSSNHEKGYQKGNRRIDHIHDWVCKEIIESHKVRKCFAIYMGGATLGEVNPLDLPKEKPILKHFFETVQTNLIISESQKDHEFEPIFIEIRRRLRGASDTHLTLEATQSVSKNIKKKIPNEVHCYNCNRRDLYLSLIDFFKHKKDHYNHLHVFMETQDVHKPESLVARFAYDEDNHFFQQVEPILGTETTIYGNGLENPYAIKKVTINYFQKTTERIKDTLDNLDSGHKNNKLSKEWGMLFFEINGRGCISHDEKKIIDFFNENNFWDKYKNKKLIFFYWIKTSNPPQKKSVFDFFIKKKNVCQSFVELQKSFSSNKNILYLNDFPLVNEDDLKDWFSLLNYDISKYSTIISEMLPGSNPKTLADIEPILLENIPSSYKKYPI